MAFQWVNENEVQNALENIRKQETKWALFDYQDDKIGLNATGAGGLESVSPLLPEDGVAYFVLNVDVKDQDEGGELFSNNKNIFVTWVGTKCKPMTKAKSSQHRRPLYQYALKFLQLGAELQVLEPSELSDALVLEKLRGTRVESDGAVPYASGTSSSTSSSAPVPSEVKATAPGLKKPVGVTSSSGHSTFAGSSGVKNEVDFVNADEANTLLQDVRNDSTPTNWVLFGHEGSKNVLKVIGSGTGGYSELEGLLKDEEIVYGVLGVVVNDEDGGSDYSTTKYIFISWVGPKVKPLTKARSSQVRVGLYKHAKNYLQLAAELQALDRSEISDELIKQKLNATF